MTAMTEANIPAADDPHRWLEDVTGSTALEWVKESNAESVGALTGGDRFEQLRTEIREVLDSDDRIPMVTRRGELLYNFWQDAANPRGLWRRTTLERYRDRQPEWELLLDVDALAAEEGENWVWQGAAVLRPDYRHALVELSRGGADASVVREFDLVEKRFVPDGFTLPEAKSQVAWIDRDTIYVGTDFGPGSLTTSGYPRLVKEWRRGTPLADATLIYEGKPEDVHATASHDPTKGFERDFVLRDVEFFRSEVYLRRGDELIRLDIPEDALFGAHREWLLVQTRSAWQVGDTTYQPGTLLAADFDAFVAGSRDLTVLFEPDAHNHLSYYSWTRNHVIVHTLSDVRSRLTVLTPGPDGWQRSTLPGVPEDSYTDLVDTESDTDDAFMLLSSGFTEPATLTRGVIGNDEVEVLKRAPAYFDATGLTVRQFSTTSDDGTTIPYFVVGPEKPNGGPTLLYGYGGFEIAMTPAYSGTIGRGWLARGGTYVVANIRGGGEYGPEWHTSVLKENRYRVYEDFSAVARDLVARGITTKEQLGTEGGSNGGLLMGVMLTRYPELFGAIVCKVPLLDMYRYHELLAGASWIAEYGDPREPDEWAYISKYSPYQNARAGRPYPPTLFMTSTRDDRVHPGHARKMVARLRELGYHVDYYENVEGGHGAAADNEQRAFNSALEYEFLWRKLSD
jgi:prolyl oligopeptidase